MSAQSVLAKFPKKIVTNSNRLSQALNVSNDTLNEMDYGTYFKPILDYPDYEFITEVSIAMANNLNV
jgi:hypothetical protein